MHGRCGEIRDLHADAFIRGHRPRYGSWMRRTLSPSSPRQTAEGGPTYEHKRDEKSAPMGARNIMQIKYSWLSELAIETGFIFRDE